MRKEKCLFAQRERKYRWERLKCSSGALENSFTQALIHQKISIHSFHNDARSNRSRPTIVQ